MMKRGSRVRSFSANAKKVSGISINLSNRVAYSLIAILMLAIVGVGVLAFGTNTPSTFGHSLGEIAPPSPCTSGQVLSWTGTAWACAVATLTETDPQVSPVVDSGKLCHGDGANQVRCDSG